jgi:hypothetical protein
MSRRAPLSSMPLRYVLGKLLLCHQASGVWSLPVYKSLAGPSPILIIGWSKVQVLLGPPYFYISQSDNHCSAKPDHRAGHHLRHCLFSLARNSVQQHSISKETIEKFVGMELFVPSFEGARKRSTRPPIKS